jgi:hypothetical protein
MAGQDEAQGRKSHAVRQGIIRRRRSDRMIPMYRSPVRILVPRLVLGLALLIWMALPIALELRPPVDWEIPQGTVLNADPEPPWPMVLHAGESDAIAGTPESDLAVLLPRPAARDGAETVHAEAASPLHDPIPPATDLLTLHQRRNE